MLNWPFQPSATLTVQGLGFWLAIVGLLISLVGFRLTLQQLDRTKKATDAVSDELKKVQFAVSKYDATLETSRAESSLSSARRHVKAGDWDQAGEALEGFAKSMHTILKLSVAELEPHKSDIDDAATHADRLCERLDRAGASGLPDSDKQKSLSTLREHDRLITSMRIALDRSNIGD